MCLQVFSLGEGKVHQFPNFQGLPVFERKVLVLNNLLDHGALQVVLQEQFHEFLAAVALNVPQHLPLFFLLFGHVGLDS